MKLLQILQFKIVIKSLPMWERGLKRLVEHHVIHIVKSLPMWERGLKLEMYLGAQGQYRVAPHVGAWIETLKVPIPTEGDEVAPHVGAWIETVLAINVDDTVESLPMWERGLKPLIVKLK